MGLSWFGVQDLAALLPIIALAVGACATLLIGAFSRSEEARAALGFVSIGAIVIAAVGVAAAWTSPATVGQGAMRLGPFATFMGFVVLGGGALSVLQSSGYARDLGIDLGEYYGLILFALTGMTYLAAANDLVTIFIAFELMSLSVYALVAIHRGEPIGYEGAMKYFVLGAFSSGFLLFGMALIYGSTGTIYLNEMRWVVAAGAPGILLTGLALLLVGFAFKVGAVPFHSWVPDAYQAAPASVTGFMAIAVKAAAFGIFVRVLAGLGVLMPSVGMEGEPLSAAVWVLAFVTLVLGNLLALAQDDLKRLLAYSGIAHSGYILVGLAAATRVSELAGAGVTGALFYLAGYTVTTAGVFCVITMLREDGRDIETVSDLKGLAKERPGAALCLTICLLSLVGMPPTVGFLGKLWVFKAAIEARFVGLVVAASVATMISIYYYLRPIVLMYTGESEGRPVTRSTLGANVALVTATALTLLFGILPAWIYEYADLGAVSLIGGF